MLVQSIGKSQVEKTDKILRSTKKMCRMGVVLDRVGSQLIAMKSAYTTAGVTVCEMLIDEETRSGWKILAQHVNLLDRALKRHIILEGLNDTEKSLLKDALVTHNPKWWENSSDDLKQGLDIS